MPLRRNVNIFSYSLMPFYRPLTRRHRLLAPPHCSLTPICRLLAPLLKPSMHFHRSLMPLRRTFDLYPK